MKKNGKMNKLAVNASRARGRLPAGSSQSPEYRHVVTGANLTALNGAPSVANPAYAVVSSLNLIGEGDGQTDRSGLKVQPVRLDMRIKVAVDPNSNATYANLVSDAHLFRVTIVKDLTPQGSAVTWDQVFKSTPTGNGQEYDYQRFEYLRRFKVLYDKFVRVPPSIAFYDGTNYHSGGNFAFLKFSLALAGQDTWFSDSGSGLSSVSENNYFMFISADASSSAYTHMKYSFRSNFVFEDY